MASALEVGILVERGGLLELHPLARSFLEDRCAQLGFVPEPDSVAKTVEHYIVTTRLGRCIRRHRSKSAWRRARAARSRGARRAPRYRPASDRSRRWCELGATLGPRDVRRSRWRDRKSLFDTAISPKRKRLRKSAARDGSELKFRALCVADEQPTSRRAKKRRLSSTDEPRRRPPTDVARRDALWGQLICAIELELPEATENLRAACRRRFPFRHSGDLAVRDYGLAYGSRFGRLDLTDADAAHELLSTVDDPLVVSSFQSCLLVGPRSCCAVRRCAQKSPKSFSTRPGDIGLTSRFHMLLLDCSRVVRRTTKMARGGGIRS